MRVARFSMHLYPPEWRRRYGNEMEDLISSIKEERGSLPFRFCLDLVLSGLQIRATTILNRLGRHRHRIFVGILPIAIALATVITFGVLAPGSSSPNNSQREPTPITRSAHAITGPSATAEAQTGILNLNAQAAAAAQAQAVRALAHAAAVMAASQAAAAQAQAQQVLAATAATQAAVSRADAQQVQAEAALAASQDAAARAQVSTSPKG